MSEVDRKRIAGVRTPEALGGTYRDGIWTAPDHWPEADAMHALLLNRVDALAGCTENSAEEEELVSIGEAIEAYEASRAGRPAKSVVVRVGSRRRTCQRSRSNS